MTLACHRPAGRRRARRAHGGRGGAAGGVVECAPMLTADIIAGSRDAVAQVVREAGNDHVEWSADGRTGRFRHCPSCGVRRRPTMTVGLHHGRYKIKCHRCERGGDAIGLLHAYRTGGDFDTRGIGNKFFQYLRFFATELLRGGTERRVLRGRRHWAQALLMRDGLLSAEQSLALAWASSSSLITDRRALLDYTCGAAQGHVRDTMRRRAARWSDDFFTAARAIDSTDAARWSFLRGHMQSTDTDGNFIFSAGARFLIVCAFYSVAAAPPSLAAMASEARVSVRTARRWWNFWVASGVFTGRVFVPRRPSRRGNQLSLSLADAVPPRVRARGRQRVFSRHRLWVEWLVVLAASRAQCRGIIKPPR